MLISRLSHLFFNLSDGSGVTAKRPECKKSFFISSWTDDNYAVNCVLGESANSGSYFGKVRLQLFSANPTCSTGKPIPDESGQSSRLMEKLVLTVRGSCMQLVFFREGRAEARLSDCQSFFFFLNKVRKSDFRTGCLQCEDIKSCIFVILRTNRQIDERLTQNVSYMFDKSKVKPCYQHP